MSAASTSGVSGAVRPGRPARRGRALAAVAAVLVVAAGIGGAAPGAPASPSAPEQTDNPCAGVETRIDLVGSTSAREALLQWGPALCQSAGVEPSYLDVGSKGGRDAVTPADAAVIGLTALPFTTEEQAALEEQERGIVMVPVLATSVVCTYWDRHQNDTGPAGQRYPNMRISRRTLADLYGGTPRDNTNFSADLAADNAGNPDFVVTPPVLSIEPYMRSGFSAVTHELTRWFAGDEQARTDFLDSSFVGATVPFEEAPVPQGGITRLVSDYSVMRSGMTTALANLSIGCMDGATAYADFRPETPDVDRLNLAWLDNAAGQFVAPTGDAVSRGVAGMQAQDDGTYVPDPALADAAAYPMPMVVYAALPTCGIDAATREGMDTVMTYALGAGQQNLPAGNVALPTPVAATAATQLDAWRELTTEVGACGEGPPTPPTTGPGTTPSTLAPVDGGGGLGPDGGVYTDPSLGGGGGSGSGSDEQAAGPGAGSGDGAGAAGGGGGTGGGGDDEGPLEPVTRIAAIVRGLASLPPLVVLLGGVLLLAGGSGLQVAGGRLRPGSVPWIVTSWFRKLRP